MPPEDRVTQHEQWLLDHDRAIAEIRTTLQEHIIWIAATQREQSVVLLALSQHIACLLDPRQDDDAMDNGS